MRQPPEKDGAGPVLRLGIEAEAMQDGGGARRRRIGADIVQPRLDLGAAEAVRRLGFGDKGACVPCRLRAQLRSGFRDRQALPARPRRSAAAGQGDARRPPAEISPCDDAKQRGLSRPVASDEPDLAAGRQGEGRTIEQNAVADTVSKVVDVQHGRLLTREGE